MNRRCQTSAAATDDGYIYLLAAGFHQRSDAWHCASWNSGLDQPGWSRYSTGNQWSILIRFGDGVQECLPARILQVTPGAPHIRHVNAGSCNGGESELLALNNPYYNLHRLGIFFTPSPRFADLLLITGSVAYAMREPLLETYNAMPEPRWVRQQEPARSPAERLAPGTVAPVAWVAFCNLEREYERGPHFVKRLIFNHEVAPIFGPNLFAPLTRFVHSIASAVSVLQSGYLNFYNALIDTLLVLILACPCLTSDWPGKVMPQRMNVMEIHCLIGSPSLWQISAYQQCGPSSRRGALHSQERDAASISHHYDKSAELAAESPPPVGPATCPLHT